MADPFAPADGVEGLGRPRWSASALLATLAVGAVLYVGQAIFVPLALAALLAFVLDPIVGWLRRIGLPRTPAVVAVMLATVLVLGATTVFVVGQVTHLATNLPTYQTTVQDKLRSLRHRLAEKSGRLDATSRMLSAVGGELDAARRDLSGTPPAAPPIRVAMTPAPRSALQALGDIVDPLLGPLGTMGAVLLFLMFVLIERHDMRDRLLRLTGANLHRSTDALSEAGQRVSRYLTMQLLVNLSYGIPLGLGLWLIGVPGAPLWGLLGALLRFVPYVGPVVAAIFPLTLAFAVDPGWQMVIWTLALVATLELISNNLVEPWLYGASTGLSALAIVVSAMFWTLLWGPIGLILATPLTVCLAVLGRHVTQLSWLDVLLGSEPVFDSPTRLYQRLLAGDVEEAIEMCETQARAEGVLACYSGTAVPAMALASRAHSREASAAHRHRVSTGMGTLLRSLRDDLPAPASDTAAMPPRVLCVGARWEIDTLAAEMLVHALEHAGVPVRVAPATAVSADHIQVLDITGIDVVCVSVFSGTPEAQVRYIARRLKRRAPGIRVLVGLWNAPPDLLDADGPSLLGTDGVASSLGEMVQRLQAWLALPAAAGADEAPPAPPRAQEQQRLRAVRTVQATGPTARAVLDRAALRAADVFDAPMAMVTLVDADEAHWLGTAGLDLHAPHIPRVHRREALPCDRVVRSGEALFVEDAERDPLLSEHPLRRDLCLRSYAGAPLADAHGRVLGTLCIVDREPRVFGSAERRLLHTMATALMTQLDKLEASERRRRGRLARQGTPRPGSNAPGEVTPTLGSVPAT
jgi:predicted PurR-regulated permease PerM